jgi:hypothetical protein
VKTETYVYDGITYVISLYEGDHRFHSAWTCTVCRKTGDLPDLFWTAEDAIARAKEVAVAEHHAVVHQGGG